jgi:hypothetical protein
MYKGYLPAVFSQVPYTVIMLGTFEYLESNTLKQNQDLRFNKNDEYPFAIKFVQRFGAATASLLIASSLLYPFDTIKRQI